MTDEKVETPKRCDKCGTQWNAPVNCCPVCPASTTPRTDEAMGRASEVMASDHAHFPAVAAALSYLVECSRQLERELSAKCAELEATRNTRTEQFFRIGQLESELERVKGEEEMVTRAYDAIFPYVPDAIPLDEKINELLKLYERAEQRATTAEAERDELKTRLHGEHDAHMDCHKKLEAAEAALARANACIRDFAVIAKLHDKADATITIRQGLKVWTGKHAAAIDAALSEAVPLSKERTDEIMNDLGFPSIRTNEKQ
jgi:chromosome segregation ATPase